MIEALLQDRPYADRFTIAEIEDLPLGLSGRAYKIRDDRGRLYKLRVCSSIDQARHFEAYIRRLEKVFPPFYDRDRHYLLLSFLTGKTLAVQKLTDDNDATRKQRDAVFFGIGKLHAYAHQCAWAGRQDTLDAHFETWLGQLAHERWISRQEKETSSRVYRALRQDLDYTFRLDLRDAAPQNFVWSSNRLYYVDEAGIGCIRGVGLARFFRFGQQAAVTDQLRERYRRHLWDGYTGIHPKDLCSEYLLLVSLYDQVRRLHEALQRSAKPTVQSGPAIDLDVTRFKAFIE